MKLVTELNENEVIHCKTIEEWDRVSGLMGNPHNLNPYDYSRWGSGSVIFHNGRFGDIEFASNNGYVILSLSDFPSPAITPPISLTHTIGKYVAAQHDGKLYLFKGNQSMVLTKDIINHIKQIV